MVYYSFNIKKRNIWDEKGEMDIIDWIVPFS